jgi:hypothetical protein
MKFSTILWTMAVVGLLSGCVSVMDRRISAHKETWRGLSELDQNRLRHGLVRRGDTEDMVSIALGPPDKVLPITGRDGQKQTVWIYHQLWFGGSYDPFNPGSSPDLQSRDESVIFHDGIVVIQVEMAIENVAELVEFPAGLAEFPAKRTAEFMEARLDRLVALTPDQKVKARDIFEKANEELLAFSLDDRPAKGMPIRVRMRADIRAILTLEQQTKYDAAPQYLGGGSTKRQPR